MPWVLVPNCTRRSIIGLGGRQHVQVNGRYLTLLLHHDVLYCVDSVCYHACGPLGDGPVADIEDIPTIRCMWHNYIVALDTGERVTQELQLPGEVGGGVHAPVQMSFPLRPWGGLTSGKGRRHGEPMQRVHPVREVDAGGAVLRVGGSARPPEEPVPVLPACSSTLAAGRRAASGAAQNGGRVLSPKRSAGGGGSGSPLRLRSPLRGAVAAPARGATPVQPPYGARRTTPDQPGSPNTPAASTGSSGGSSVIPPLVITAPPAPAPVPPEQLPMDAIEVELEEHYDVPFKSDRCADNKKQGPLCMSIQRTRMLSGGVAEENPADAFARALLQKLQSSVDPKVIKGIAGSASVSALFGRAPSGGAGSSSSSIGSSGTSSNPGPSGSSSGSGDDVRLPAITPPRRTAEQRLSFTTNSSRDDDETSSDESASSPPCPRARTPPPTSRVSD